MSFRNALFCALCATALNGACSVEVNGGKEGPFDQNDDDAMTPHDASPADAGDGAINELPDAGPLDAGEREPDAAVDAYVPPPDPRDVVLGHYGLRRRFRTVRELRVGIFNTDLQVLTTTFAVAELTKAIDDSYVLREQDCRVRVDTESSSPLVSVEVSVADEVPRSAPSVESVLEVDLEGDTLRFAKPLTSVPVGWVAGGTSDPLPATSMDARVRDSDGDGNPGVTTRVVRGTTFRDEGDAYFVQWNRTFYQGKRERDGRLVGENVDESTQQVIGTSPGDEVLASSQEVYASEDKSQNVVELVPLTDELDCDGLLEQADALFTD